MNLSLRQNYRQPPALSGSHESVQPTHALTQHVAVIKQQRVKRLVLCGGTNSTPDGEIGKETRDLRSTQRSRMTPVVKLDETTDPPHVSLFRTPAVMT